ncbi:MAG: hypothetical protein V7767_14390, partial [Leeuwenhoekiella sp.]
KRMANLKHQLLKLDKAVQEQGEQKERESKSNDLDFNNTSLNKVPIPDNYFNTKEILSREALPLDGKFKTKVQAYFDTDDN